ncbi:MAG TPA: hypothetical protein VNW28_10350, partial [Chthoniobacterales bacterium]|nr:hypothetical protein [Chthoniobacterales bacterium]
MTRQRQAAQRGRGPGAPIWRLTIAAWCACAPLATEAAIAAQPSPEPVAELSAQRAAAERGKIYQAGVVYSQWIDGLAQESGSPFLQQRVLDRVTWMRLLACAGTLLVVGLATAWFLRFVRRRAGRIESDEQQSWLALGAAAICKPLALLAWVIGGFLSLMPIAEGIASRPTRLFLANGLTAILYAGWVIAVFWLIFQIIRGAEKRMRQWAQGTGKVLNNVIVPVAGQTLRLAVPLLAILLFLPLLNLPDRWTWVTQKGFGILLIVSLASLIIRGVRAVQVALMREHRLDVEDNLAARRIYTQVSVIRKIVIAAVVILATGS